VSNFLKRVKYILLIYLKKLSEISLVEALTSASQKHDLHVKLISYAFILTYILFHHKQ